MTQTLKTSSERMLADYLKINGYSYQHHPDLDIQKRPDFLVTRADDRFVCEIKEFDPKNMALARYERELAAQGGGTYWPDAFPHSVRNTIRSAAEQLKELAGREPLVVVLANPNCAPVDLGGPELVEAIAGDLGFRFNFDSEAGKTVGPAMGFYGRNGKLTNDHQYISAVVGLHLHEGSHAPKDRYAAHVVHTRSEEAQARPLTVLNGPHDRVWTPAGKGWREVRPSSQ